MTIIERYCIGKRENVSCEDGWVVTSNFAAVVDGSTAKIKIEPGQESPGHLAMRLVCEAIKHLSPSTTKEQALHILTQTLASNHSYEQSHYRPTCSAVIYSRFYNEVWFIGDCQARWNGCTHIFEKRVDKILTDIRCRVIHYYLQHGYTEEDIRKEDKGRAFIFDALREQVHFQNDSDTSNPYRYPVIDGQPIDASLIPSMKLNNVYELILASDGYPELFDTLAETESRLQHILATDPLCINEHPATKCLVEGNRSFDDRTYLRLRIND